MYHELEAAFASGYTLSEWQSETPKNRAQVIAHHMHKNMREGYQAEAVTAKPKDDKQGNGHKSLLRTMGL